MTGRRRLAGHAVAAALLVGGLALVVLLGDAPWVRLLAEAMRLLAIAWFAAPLALRFQRFRARGEETRRRLNA